MTIRELAITLRCPEYFDAFMSAFGDTAENRKAVDAALKEMARTQAD